MGRAQTTVVMVISDSPNMARAALACLRRHYADGVLLVDISQTSSRANRALAAQFDCALKRLPPFDERQFYAHSTALDFVLPTLETEFAILLDNDCFVFSDTWASRLIEPLRNDAGCVAAGPERGGVVTFGNTPCALLGTWATGLRVSAILDTGISVFARGSDVIDDTGRQFQIDTLDANLILAALAGGRTAPVADIADSCFHIGAVTTGSYLLRLYTHRPQTFLHYFRSVLRLDPAHMIPMLHRIMINAHCTARFFGDRTITESQYTRFKREEPGDERAKQVEEAFDSQVLPRLRDITAPPGGPM